MFNNLYARHAILATIPVSNERDDQQTLCSTNHMFNKRHAQQTLSFMLVSSKKRPMDFKLSRSREWSVSLPILLLDIRGIPLVQYVLEGVFIGVIGLPRSVSSYSNKAGYFGMGIDMW